MAPKKAPAKATAAASRPGRKPKAEAQSEPSATTTTTKKATTKPKSEANAKVTKNTTKKATNSKNAANTSKKVTADSKTKTTTAASAGTGKKAAGKSKAQSSTQATKDTTTTKKRPGRKPKAETEGEASQDIGPQTNGKRKASETAEPEPRASKKAKAETNDETPTTATTTKKNATGKRKASEHVEPEAPARKRAKVGPLINNTRSDILKVFVCGEGSAGELGLGAEKNAIDVKRPRYNHFLAPEKAGVVQVAVGGMHCAAITSNNKIMTWGVNDQGALGRDTEYEGNLKDIDEAKKQQEKDDARLEGDKEAKKEDSDSDSENPAEDLNPLEATPTAIPDELFPEGTVFTQVACSDSATFALTNDGQVYGWGTFRSNEGIFGFDRNTLIQRTPVAIPQLKKITKLACGANHVLALDLNGNVFAWGSGQQNQLGRRVVERTKHEGLVPREFGLPRKRITDVGCGAYHSFAIDKDDNVWAWGLNNYGETGIPAGAGDDEAVVLKPAKIDALAGKAMEVVDGGAHHSVGVTKDGQCLVWGRIDGCQMGIHTDKMDKENVTFDSAGRPRILNAPMQVPEIDAASATCGSDHTIAVTKAGRAYAWGFSANYQTGLGTDDDVMEATLIDNTALRAVKVNWAGAGGQFSVFTALAGDEDTAGPS
ncbi:RCC1/BLIP-II [Viridothelium virens]|uniref:RCC1/BLIP-II n=1 Tax=Viridothelium virens TaxID=1048519 RepID=A0A6A6H163_VIRVR|nr:RCC1/BLIP-II [Viridothelium virens]